MKVGILGSGVVAQALGKGFAAKGHEVKLGTRDPRKLEAWKQATGPKASVGSFADAARHGEVLVLATKGDATLAVLDLAGLERFAGKVLIDATNPLDQGMPPGIFSAPGDSLAERVQRKLPKAKVVKAFNTVPNAAMANAPQGARLPIAGDDAAAKKQVEAIAHAFGWVPMDLGGLGSAYWMEAFVPLWVRSCLALGRWDLVFDPR
jgi:hypothetical protein